MFLARKEMRKEKGRYILIISIFMLISYLVYFLTGLAYGLSEDNRTAIDDWNASQIVLARGSNSNIISSMLDRDKVEDDLKGKDYSLINLSRSAAYKDGDDSLEENLINLTLIGMDIDSKSFPKIIEGNPIKDDHDVIASSSLKDEEGLEIGDSLELTANDEVYKIVGFTKDLKYNVSPVIYTRLSEASASNFFNNPSRDDETKMPSDLKIAENVSAAILFDDTNPDLSSDYDVDTIGDFIEEVPGYSAQNLTFGLMIGFLIVIAAIVLGVFLYIITIQKQQTFGIMKIQGISNGYISRSVIIQTLLVSLIGLAIGLGLTYLTDYFLPRSVPFKSNTEFYLIISLLILVTSQIGAIFSVRSVSKIDPLDVI